MVTAVDRTRRALVSLLKSLAGVYHVVLSLTRESSDQEVRSACRKLSRKAHPDLNGSVGHQQSLNNAHGEWQKAILRSKKAQNVAKAKFIRLKKVCQEVFRKRGAASRG